MAKNEYTICDIKVQLQRHNEMVNEIQVARELHRQLSQLT